MIRTFINSFNVSFAENANTFIYFLKRIPFIGKKIPEKLYKQTRNKLIVGVIGKILGMIVDFLKRALYIGLLIILPSYLMTKSKILILPKFLHIFFFLNFIIGTLMGSIVFDYKNKSAFDMIVLMRSDARKYYLGEILYEKITNFIYFIIPLVLIGLIIGLSPLKAVMLIVEVIALEFIGEWFYIFIYVKTGKSLAQNNYFISAVIIIGLALAYALPVAGLTINFQPVLFNAFVMIILLFLGVAAYIYMWRCKAYAEIAKTGLSKEKLINRDNALAEIKFASVKIDEKKISKEDLKTKIFEKKKGYEYLNSLFFQRFRGIMVTPVKRRVSIIAVGFLAVIVSILFLPEKNELIFRTIQKSAPGLVFIMYCMSTGEIICKAMFYNCDISLLRYGYYREGSVILSNFTSRLKRTVFLNLIPAIALSIALTGITIASGYGSKLTNIIPVVLCIPCLACFFSIHHLFMYYVLQPYTAELTVKSPLFKFMNGIIYFLSYMCLNIKTSSYYFALGVLVVTITYMAVALILTYRLAPKTFKLK